MNHKAHTCCNLSPVRCPALTQCIAARLPVMVGVHVAPQGRHGPPLHSAGQQQRTGRRSGREPRRPAALRHGQGPRQAVHPAGDKGGGGSRGICNAILALHVITSPLARTHTTQVSTPYSCVQSHTHPP